MCPDRLSDAKAVQTTACVKIPSGPRLRSHHNNNNKTFYKYLLCDTQLAYKHRIVIVKNQDISDMHVLGPNTRIYYYN
jgi:hypothetical protein